MADAGPAADLMPRAFEEWFAGRGWAARERTSWRWSPRAAPGRDALLIAPTGGGKTLAGFLPSLIELAERPPAEYAARAAHALHLAAEGADGRRGAQPDARRSREMGLNIVAESRTGDTGIARRQRQRIKPPDILLTTPEQLALLCAWDGARLFFEDLRCVILDEIHTICSVQARRPAGAGSGAAADAGAGHATGGLSATVDDPAVIRTGWRRIE